MAGFYKAKGTTISLPGGGVLDEGDAGVPADTWTPEQLARLIELGCLVPADPAAEEAVAKAQDPAKRLAAAEAQAKKYKAEAATAARRVAELTDLLAKCDDDRKQLDLDNKRLRVELLDANKVAKHHK